MNTLQPTSTQPYLIRALYEWCTDNGLTPHLAVKVDARVQVPMELVVDGEIVLNVGFDATSGLDMGNDYIRFQARFGGIAREIIVPVDHVVAIYARESGQGMAFPEPATPSVGVEELPALIDQAHEKSDDMPLPLKMSSPSPEPAALHLVGEDDPPDAPPSAQAGQGKKGKKSAKPTLRIVK